MRPNVPSIYTEPGTDSISPCHCEAFKHWTKRSKSRWKANSSRDTRYFAMVFCWSILTCFALWINSFMCPSLECNQVGAKKLQEDAESVCPYKAQGTVARSCWVLYGTWNPLTIYINIYIHTYIDCCCDYQMLLCLLSIYFHGCSAGKASISSTIFCRSWLHLFTGSQRRDWGAMLLCCFVYLLMGVGKLNCNSGIDLKYLLPRTSKWCFYVLLTCTVVSLENWLEYTTSLHVKFAKK